MDENRIWVFLTVVERAALQWQVWRRDDFTCRHCRRTPPRVHLTAEYVVDPSDGGQDEVRNLRTSCIDCNPDGGWLDPFGIWPTDYDVPASIARLLEDEQQQALYDELRERVRIREESDIQELLGFWRGLWSEELEPISPFTYVLRTWLGDFVKADIRLAMTMAAERKRASGSGSAVGYLAGILRRWRAFGGPA